MEYPETLIEEETLFAVPSVNLLGQEEMEGDSKALPAGKWRDLQSLLLKSTPTKGRPCVFFLFEGTCPSFCFAVGLKASQQEKGNAAFL